MQLASRVREAGMATQLRTISQLVGCNSAGHLPGLDLPGAMAYAHSSPRNAESSCNSGAVSPTAYVVAYGKVSNAIGALAVVANRALAEVFSCVVPINLGFRIQWISASIVDVKRAP